jgi:hypothetical protein
MIGSLQPVVENLLKYPFLPIVYLLRVHARYLFPPQPKRYKARAEIIPIYIHIKTKTFIYMSDLLCRSVGNFTYLLSLIILYFSYIARYDRRRVVVSCGLQGVHMTGTIPLKGGHSRKNLPEFDTKQTKWENFSQTKERCDDRKRETMPQVR